jgi:hypothetical protein
VTFRIEKWLVKHKESQACAREWGADEARRGRGRGLFETKKDRLLRKACRKRDRGERTRRRQQSNGAVCMHEYAK